MQANKLFFALCVCTALCACSNDELGAGDTQKVFTGDEAYINVRLTEAGSLTRANSSTSNDGYEDGTYNERAVQNAFFYFYDANGVFVSEGSAWNDGSVDTKNTNIEFESNTVVVLKGLTKKNYPKYMVTVLNRPTDFATSVPETLAQMEKTLADEDGVGITVDDKFVMSTSSYAKSTASEKDKPTYFVTEINDENFFTEPVDNTNPDKIKQYVKVYVERLAAKVTLSVAESSDRLEKEEINGETYYKIKATVAGEGNDADKPDENTDTQTGGEGDSGSSSTGSDATTGSSQQAAEDLYVKLLGWKLNATAKSSYLVKNIDETWRASDADTGSGTVLGFTWNKAEHFRSFWGKSFNYGNNTTCIYPTTGKGYNDANTAIPLHYVDLQDNGLIALGTADYCAENTNTGSIVSAYFPSAVTSILLKARVCDKDGKALDLVRFKGVLFKKDPFVSYILNAMQAKSQWNVWVKTTAQESVIPTFAQAGTDKVELVHVADGNVKVQLKTLGDDEKLYQRSRTEGSYTFTEITDFTTINGALETECDDAIGYKSGLMYYNIPIEHLNNTVPTTESDKTIYPEAKYGVVRNHSYKVTITSLEKIGKGIFEPSEVIVPDDSDDDKETYYVGATIKILSWKIVSQDVEL